MIFKIIHYDYQKNIFILNMIFNSSFEPLPKRLYFSCTYVFSLFGIITNNYNYKWNIGKIMNDKEEEI